MLTIRLFGGASIEGPEGPLTGRIAQRRPLALVALLAVDRAPSISRDRLLLLLSPDSHEERARHLLRDTVYAVRAALGADAIVTAGDELRLGHDGIGCDVREFQEALAAEDWERAVALRHGPFLDGFHLRDSPEFEAWAAMERQRLDDAYAGALASLATAARAAGDPGTSARWWAQRLVLDPLNAGTTMALMTALHAAGDVAGALRRSTTHAALLRSELDASPDPSVVALAERLRHEPVPPPANPAGGGDAGVAAGMDAEVDAGVDAGMDAGARVAEGPAAADPSPATTPGQRVLPPPHASRWFHLARLAAAAVAVTVLVVAARGALGTPEPELDPRRVAVAPLRNATGEVQLGSIGSMAADWITQGLTRTALLEVVPTLTVMGSVRREQSFGARDDSVPFRSLGEWTGAGTVVFGSYYRDGEELIFQVQIADARQGIVLTALEPVRTPVDSPLSGIEELLGHTLAAIGPILDPRTTAAAALSSRPPTFSAYRDYAEGLERFIAGDLNAATRYFEQAAVADSSYTLPRVWAALARWNSGDWLGGEALARTLAGGADRLAPNDEAIVRSILAWADGDHAAAYDAAARAHRAAPGSGMAAAQVALEAMRLNRPAETRRILASLDPDRGEMRGWAYYWQDLAEAQHLLGRPREALRSAEAARSRHPDSVVPRLIEVRAHAARGRAREVHAVLDEVSAGPAASFLAVLSRQAAQEFVVHGHADHADAVLQRGIAWSWSRLETDPGNVGIRRGLVRLLMMQGDDAGAALVMEPMPSAAEGLRNIDDLGLAALLAERTGEPRRADAFLRELEEGALPFTNGRDAWWRAAVVGARGDCDAAFDALRTGLSRGVAYGIELHHAHELQPLRACPGWEALLRPRG